MSCTAMEYRQAESDAAIAARAGEDTNSRPRLALSDGALLDSRRQAT
jgi:hypothetical protein